MAKKSIIILILALIVLFVIAGSAMASASAQETPLSPVGMAYEANLDNQGFLWVSDADAGEIRAYNTASGAFTVYPVGGGPTDARSDGAWAVWWADFSSNQLSRLLTGSNQVTTWLIPGNTGMLGTALDASGEVWVSDYNASYLYQLDPQNNEMCKVAIPDFGVAEYLLIEGGRLWFGDYINERIVRIEGLTLTWWPVHTGSYPRDLALDGSGNIWWTDVNNGAIGKLDPTTGDITSFTLPASGSPQMLHIVEDKVWFSQQAPGRLGMLDPAIANGSTTTATSSSLAIDPECSDLLPQAPVAITPVSGQASWGGQTYQTEIEQSGWTIYQMPDNSAPFGIAATNNIWVVDQGRQVLASVSQSSTVYLPLVMHH